MNKLSALNREQLLRSIQQKRFDLLVIGGGITGAGIALDAASRGLKTVLVEKDDFASGTSSRSTKLIHGGLRYLKQFEIALVREVGRERAIVHDLAPNLVTAEKMLLPLVKDGTFGRFSTSLGLMVYDVLAGVESVDQRKMLSREETLEKEPLLQSEEIEGGGIYAEYRTDDARLTMEVIKTAANYGTSSINYVKANDFIYVDNKVVGAQCTDELTGQSINIHAQFVVSAAGPWVDELRDTDHSLEGKRLHLTKGVHIVVPHERFPLKQAVYYDVSDGRMIFSIPRGKITYIGTTDTDYHGDKDHIVANKEDVDYLLKAANDAFKTIKLTETDVISSWAGVRPLIHEDGKSTSELSRKDEIFESDTGLMSIAGGKLTGYRKMAERIVDLVCAKFEKVQDVKLKKCFTDKIPLTGGPFSGAREVESYCEEVEEVLSKYGLDASHAFYLVSNYGKQSSMILEKLDGRSGGDMEENLILAECRFCIENELASDVDDFLIRRTGRLYFDIESVRKYHEAIATEMKNIFGWSDERYDSEITSIQKSIHEASHFELSEKE